jgi:hypothetical protein
MCKETEIVTQSKQGILMDFNFALNAKVGKYPSVLSQQPVNITHEIIRISVLSVVVIIPALIRTELFIGTATNGVAAIETFLFHSTKVLIKI